MPPLDAQTMAMLQYLMAMQGGMGAQTAPTMDPFMEQYLGGMVQPPMNKYGELEPYDADAQAKMLNIGQDIQYSLATPMTAALGGAGSYGPSPTGGGVFGGGGLDPITTESILETPQSQMLQYLAGQQGLEGIVAQKLLQGQTPSLIMADLQAKIADPEAAGIDPAEAAALSAALPQRDVLDQFGKPTGQTTVDWEGSRKSINDLAEPYFKEQGMLSGPNITYNNYGQPVALTEQPSPTMEWLQKMGLPDPRSQYGVDFALQSSPELRGLMGDIANKGQAFEQARSTYEKFLKDNPKREMLEARQGERDEQRKRKYATEMADWARGLATLPEAPTTPTAAPRTSQEGGAPGWLKAIGGGISDVVTGTPDYVNNLVSGMHPRNPRLPDRPNITVIPELGGRARPPAPPQMPGRSMIDMLLGGNVRAAPDRQQYTLAGNMNRAARSQGDDLLAMVRAIAPSYGAMRAGRNPFQDAIMQRMQPVFAMGGAPRPMG